MVRSMALADVCTLIADLSTELAKGFESRGVPAHPAGAEKTNITTIATKARTLRHKLVTMMLGHTDHVICASLAGLSAREADIDAVFLLLRQWAGLHDLISLDEVVDDEILQASTRPMRVWSTDWITFDHRFDL